MPECDIFPQMFLWFDSLCRRVHVLFGRIRFTLLGWVCGIISGGNCAFVGKTIVRVCRRGEIKLGRGVRFFSKFRLNTIGPATPTVLSTVQGGRIEVGDGSRFSSVFIASAKSVRIGRHVMAGANVKIFDTNFHSIDYEARRTKVNDRDEFPRSVVIGDDVSIGVGSIITKGSHVGDRCVIAAGAVLCGLKAPSDSVIFGNPAQVVQR